MTIELGSRLTTIRADLLAKLNANCPEVDGLIPVTQAINAVCTRRTLERYSMPLAYLNQISDSIQLRCHDHETKFIYNKLLLVELARDLEPRSLSARVPTSILGLLTMQLRRIYEGFLTEPLTHYVISNDHYLKDLAILALALLPCGAELAQVYSGVPRSILARGGMKQFFKGGRYFLLKTRGFRPFVSLHMDNRNLAEFSPDGWIRTYLRIADLLRSNPELKGVFGTAWFYDPAMEKVSPHLAYLRQYRIDHGAIGLWYGRTDAAQVNALAKSKRRRRLHLHGEYNPVSYYVVWSREDLLAWAANHNNPEPARTEA